MYAYICIVWGQYGTKGNPTKDMCVMTMTLGIEAKWWSSAQSALMSHMKCE